LVRPVGITRVGLALLQRAEEIARRVTFLAMRDGFGEIAAALPFCVPVGGSRRRTLAKEQHAPEPQQPPNAERKPNVALPAWLRDRLHGAQIRVDIGDVTVAHSRERGVGKNRIEIFAVIANARTQRPTELLFVPL